MDRVRVVTVNALPLPGTDEFEEFGGATINVWTTEDSEDRARAHAVREVTEAGWQVQSIEETFLLVREDLVEAAEGLKYFEQVLLDDIVVVIYTYPAKPQESDVVH